MSDDIHDNDTKSDLKNHGIDISNWAYKAALSSVLKGETDIIKCNEDVTKDHERFWQSNTEENDEKEFSCCMVW